MSKIGSVRFFVSFLALSTNIMLANSTLLSPTNLTSNFLDSFNTTSLLEESNTVWYLVRKSIPKITYNSSNSNKFKPTFNTIFSIVISQYLHTDPILNPSSEDVLINISSSKGFLSYGSKISCNR